MKETRNANHKHRSCRRHRRAGHPEQRNAFGQFLRKEFADAIATTRHDPIDMVKGILSRAFGTGRRTACEQEAMAQSSVRESAYHEQAVKRFVNAQAPLFNWPK
jgi:hypothetical protein